MQETIFYVAAGETLGSVRDFANAKSAAPPTLVRGVSALLRMRLFAHRDGLEPYPLVALEHRPLAVGDGHGLQRGHRLHTPGRHRVHRGGQGHG